MTNSPTYPFEREQNYSWLGGVEELPKRIFDYILDLPLPGYVPKESNDYPRVRLCKYIFYDEPRPLSFPALSTEQKLSLIYDPAAPDKPPTEKGFRLFPLRQVSQAQIRGQSLLKCYISKILPTDVFTVQLGLTFDIISSMPYVSNLKSAAIDRTLAIEQCLWECLNGLNLGGVGTVFCDRHQLSDCGSFEFTDNLANLGRRLCFGLTWKDSASPPNTAEL
ncbi:MAG: hypothetical protein RR085_08065 [Clostridia bacterium]